MRPEDFEDPSNWAAVGRPTWFSDIAIMSPEGKLLPTDEIGEVVARGDLLMNGYWRMPEKTAETIVDGWLHTGDRGLIDSRGFLYLKDRLKDIVITGGFNVYPVDVENALSQHPSVHECLVFGLPDEKWGETPCAFVELKPGKTATADELIAWCRTHLAAFKCPRHIVFTELPKTSTGKIQKFVLRDRVKDA
jgi:acyl-CoA synthetase (AMP-forming)/AMP-acid ligase II